MKCVVVTLVVAVLLLPQTAPAARPPSALTAFLAKGPGVGAEPAAGPVAGPGIARLDPVQAPPGFRSLSFQECVRCHAGVHAGWKLSMHSVSWVDPEVQEVWTHLGKPDGCKDCHLPLAEARSAPRKGVTAYDLTLAGEGVTCAVCHVRDGVVLAPHPGGSRAPDGKPPHPVRHEPTLGEAAFCAGCHQSQGPAKGRAVYDTFAEWQTSRYAKAGVTCQTCHMPTKPDVDRAGELSKYHTHHFRGSHADPMLMEALDVVVQGDKPVYARGDTVKATVRVTNGGAGHRVPTGSPLHGVEITVGIADGRGEFLSQEQRWLRRDVKSFVPFEEGEDTRLDVDETLTIAYEGEIPTETDPVKSGDDEDGPLVPAPDAEYFLIVQFTYHLLPPDLVAKMEIPSEIVTRTYDSRVIPLLGY